MVALFFWLKPFGATTFTLTDGTKLSLVGVTYGKKHVFPGKKDGDIDIGMGRGGPRPTTNDSLCVWFKQIRGTNQWPNFQLLVYDNSETACVGSWTSWQSAAPSKKETYLAVTFRPFPGGKKR